MLNPILLDLVHEASQSKQFEIVHQSPEGLGLPSNIVYLIMKPGISSMKPLNYILNRIEPTTKFSGISLDPCYRNP